MAAAVFSPRAKRDILGAVSWIAKDNPAAARALRDAVAAAAERIGAHPQAGMLRPDLVEKPYRFVTLTGFPYFIVYNDTRRPPLILRILHAARDLPEVLRDR